MEVLSLKNFMKIYQQSKDGRGEQAPADLPRTDDAEQPKALPIRAQRK